MDKYFSRNKAHWNEVTPVHEKSEMYDVAGFKVKKNHLDAAVMREVGEVKGKSLLHLQCHFGLDTLSWATLGAEVTGVDFSDKAIELARNLSKETGIKAEFLCVNVYDLPAALDKRYDIVYTSYGVLCWLPDLDKWARVISHFLKPGGFFYIMEGHPFMNLFDISPGVTELSVRHSYYNNDDWLNEDPGNDYADPAYIPQNGTSEWAHPLSEIINALICAGLKIEYLHESPDGFFKALPFMKLNEKGVWHLEGDKLPLTFSIKATKT